MTKTLATDSGQSQARFARRLRTLLILTAILLPAGIAASAEAQESLSCDYRDAMTSQLKSNYAEQPLGLGVTNAGTVIELWQGGEGATWTLLVTMPNGKSCIVGAGSDWMQVNPENKQAVSWKAASPKIQ